MRTIRYHGDDLTYFRWRKASAGYVCVDGRRVPDLAQPSATTVERILVTAITNDSPQRYIEYAPLVSSTGLFRRFAETVPDEVGILAFANKYGSLGGAISMGVQVDGESSIRLQGESLTDWTRAITDIRMMLAIWEAANNSKTDELAMYIRWRDSDAVFYSSQGGGELIASTLTAELPAHFKTTRNAKGQSVIESGDLVAPALYLLQRHVNQQLLDHGVAPKLLRNAGGQLVIRLSPSSLIGALWLQFAKAIEGNKAYKQCENCKDWMEVGGNRAARSDKKFCNPSCKSAFHRPKPETASVKAVSKKAQRRRVHPVEGE